MRFLSKGEIELPKTKWDFKYEDGFGWGSLKSAQFLYGPNIVELTLETAKMCIGKTVWCIYGQDWYASTIADKKKNITRIEVLGFTSDFDMSDINGQHVFNQDYDEYDEIAVKIMNDVFGVYDCGNGSFGSGSGCDPIFLFAR